MEKNEAVFEAYFSGTLSEKEIQQFNAELDSNMKFQKEYNFFLSVKKAAANIERDNMRCKLKAVNLEESIEKPTRKTNSPNTVKNTISWIIGVGIILSIIYVIFQTLSNTNEPAKLYASYFDIYQVQSARGTDTDPIKTMYSEGNYKGFISKVKAIDKSPEVNMMLANAYIQSDAFTLAQNTLLQITDESALRDQKYWYLGLLQLKQGHKVEAISYFQHLQSISQYKKSQIEDILLKLTKK